MASAPLKKIIKIANGIHVALYRRSGGKFGNTIANLPILLITTYGRKTGKPTTNPIVYLKGGEDYLVSASNGGLGYHPGWYRNLINKPDAQAQIGDKVYQLHAVITDGEERTQLYERFKAASSNFVKYEKGTSRVIPVVRLIPQ